MRKKAEFAVNTTFVLFVSIIGILALIAFFSYFYPEFSMKIYCNTLSNIRVNALLPEKVTVSNPSCKEKKDRIESAEITREMETEAYFNDGKSSIPFNFSLQNTYTLWVTIPPDSTIEKAVFILRNLDAQPKEFFITAGTFSSPITAEHEKSIDFGEALKSFRIQECSSPDSGKCIFPIIITAKTGSAIAAGLSVNYTSCFPEQILLANAIRCYETGQENKKDVLCREFIIAENCGKIKIDEKAATKYLQENNLCGALSNNDAYGDCGSKDSLRWSINFINPKSSILIKYDGETDSVIVE